MREIQLTRGLVTHVDDADYNWLSQWRWQAEDRKRKDRVQYYARTNMRINGRMRRVYMRRLILNPSQGLEVDHIDGNALNNQRSNLRLATHAENMRNQAKHGGETSSAYKGVFWHKRCSRWAASILANGKRKHLGLFDDEIEAAYAYDDAARLHYGEFARVNFPERVPMFEPVLLDSPLVQLPLFELEAAS